MGSPLLEVKNLSVTFPQNESDVRAVRDISYTISEGEFLGIVGESGSGKSVSSLAVMGLLPDTAEVTGEILFRGKSLLKLDDRELSKIRGSELAIIFQDPLSALTPVYTIGDQIGEALRLHDRMLSKQAAEKRAIELLKIVGIPDATRRVKAFPHEFSGGMRQRAMIAMALSCDPDLLIADEPTTALDVTVQAQILDLIRDLQKEFDSAVMMITHDLGVVAELADDILVMYAGRAIEQGSAQDVFYRPQHPYTWGLLQSLPRWDRERTDRLLPIPGNPPSLINVPSGCPFHPRCAYADRNHGRSETERPQYQRAGGEHVVACHLAPEERQSIWENDIKPTL